MVPIVHEQDVLTVVTGDGLGLLHDQGAKQAVAVLHARMGVVPVGATGGCREVVGERLAGGDRRTGDTLHPIHLPGAWLMHAMPMDDRGHLQVVFHREVEALSLLHPDGGADQLAAVAKHPALHAIGSRLKRIGTQAFARPAQGDHGLTGTKRTTSREQVEAGRCRHPQSQGGDELTPTHDRIEKQGIRHGFLDLSKGFLIHQP